MKDEPGNWLQGYKKVSVGERWARRILDHKAYHDKVERPAWETLSNFYRGQFFTNHKGDQEAMQGSGIRTSLNLTYAVLDSAITGLIPPKIEAAGTPAALDVTPEQVDGAAALVNYSFKQSDIREVGKKAVIDVLITGRAVYRMGWDADRDCAVVDLADVTSTFFDLSATTKRHIRYWISMRLYTADEVIALVDGKNGEPGVWNKEAARELRCSAMPAWTDRTNSNRRSDDAHGDWVVVWLCYDLQTQQVIYMPDRGEKILYVEEMEYNPFVLLTFSENGEDCRGMSELNLISANQEDMNSVLSMVLETITRSSPCIVFNKALISEDEVKKIADAKPGTYVGVDLLQDAMSGGAGMGDLWSSKPSPTLPDEAWNMLSRLENNISIVSALAASMRGQTNGGKTATEQAMLDANIRSRIGTRQTDLRDAHVEVAYILHLLNRLYMSKAKVVRISRMDMHKLVDPNTLRDADVMFDMTTYTPLDDNPAIRAETARQIFPVLLQDPNINRVSLYKHLFQELKLPWDVEALLAPAPAPAGAPPPGMGAPPIPGVPPEVAQASGAAGAPPPVAGLPPAQTIQTQDAVAARTQAG